MLSKLIPVQPCVKNLENPFIVLLLTWLFADARSTKKCLPRYKFSAMYNTDAIYCPRMWPVYAVDSFLRQCRMTIDRWHVRNCQLIKLYGYHVAIVWQCRACCMLNWDYFWSVTAMKCTLVSRDEYQMHTPANFPDLLEERSGVLDGIEYTIEGDD